MIPKTKQNRENPVRNKAAYTGEDFYLSYLDYIGENPGEQYLVDYKTFRGIIDDYFAYIASMILDKSKEVKLPARMGTIRVTKSRPEKWDRHHMHVDFRETNLTGSLVLHFNEHSDGYRYRFHWDKHTMLTTNSTLYEIVFTRFNKRRLAYLIKNRITDYSEK